MGLGSVSISNKTVEFIKSILPLKSTILEFGSGYGTTILSEFYTMYSVENQTEWMDKFQDSTTYINCRMKEYNDSDFHPPNIIGPQTSWYDPKDLFHKLPKNYDLILIDGPGGHWGRGGFLKFLDKFNTNIPILFDDINREAEFDLMVKTSIKLEKKYEILNNDKALGYIL